MRMCVHTCMRACVRAFVCARLFVDLFVYACAYARVRVCVRVRTCACRARTHHTNANTPARAHTHTQTRIHTQAHTHTHSLAHTHTLTHTHTHTHTQTYKYIFVCVHICKHIYRICQLGRIVREPDARLNALSRRDHKLTGVGLEPMSPLSYAWGPLGCTPGIAAAAVHSGYKPCTLIPHDAGPPLWSCRFGSCASSPAPHLPICFPNNRRAPVVAKRYHILHTPSLVVMNVVPTNMVELQVMSSCAIVVDDNGALPMSSLAMVSMVAASRYVVNKSAGRSFPNNFSHLNCVFAAVSLVPTKGSCEYCESYLRLPIDYSEGSARAPPRLSPCNIYPRSPIMANTPGISADAPNLACSPPSAELGAISDGVLLQLLVTCLPAVMHPPAEEFRHSLYPAKSTSSSVLMLVGK